MPVDVVLHLDDDQAGRVAQWSVRSLDVYGEGDEAHVERRTLVASNDRNAIVMYLENAGYVRVDADGARYRRHDDTCGRCGAYVPAGERPPLGEGWHAGREYRRFGGGLQVLRVRCPAHPFDVEGEVFDFYAAGLL
jgi:hypothetical protein